jgi:uncharacterized protein YbjT (DUF2867 family)
VILITGGTGNSGTAVVEQLRAKGVPFRMMVRDPKKVSSAGWPEGGVVAGDMSRPETLGAALKGIEVLFLLSPPAANQVEVETNVVNAAKAAGVRHIVKFSAMTAAPNAEQRFPCAHGKVEEAICKSGLAWTFLRPTFFMQNMLGFGDMVRQGVIYQPARKSKAAFVDTRDIAAVAVAALTEPGHEGKAYEITGPQLLSYDDVAAIFSRVIGTPVKYQDIPPAAAKQAMLGMGIPDWNCDGINELMDQMRADQYAMTTDAVRAVGHKAPTTLEQFIRENARAWA